MTKQEREEKKAAKEAAEPPKVRALHPLTGKTDRGGPPAKKLWGDV